MKFDKELWEVEEHADDEWTERSLFNVVSASGERVIGDEGLFVAEDVDRERAKLFAISRELHAVACALLDGTPVNDVRAFARATLARYEINTDLLT